MQESVCYENYPLRIVILSNLLSVSVYVIGLYLVSLAGIVWAFLYLIYIALLEIRLLGWHCNNCYYYGKTCAFGKGRLSKRLFPKGDPEKFKQKKITCREMAPDFAVIVIPVLAGIFSIITEFQFQEGIEFRWTTLVLILILLILGSSGNAFVRGRLSCTHCRQREAGCPAVDFFDKKS